ncbi:hypothetical protein DPMN_028360 [Dreissena polymorpha]|uniref:Uncharacterized protein n=1 Tax=Dreissena polymorpha TaxID=45954 RepID=A0A9D4REB3_DREPO|nr:hypothetical protein DPMN_028360 [Dreissena polymorpha]
MPINDTKSHIIKYKKYFISVALQKQPKNLETFLNDVEFALKEGFLKDVGQDTSPTASK